MSGQMGRRSFLAMLGLAPFAAPAAVASAGKSATVRFIGASTPFLGGGKRILSIDEIDPYPTALSQGDPIKLRDLSRLTYADMHPEAVVARATSPTTASPLCPVFVDDVGGGP